MTYHPRDVLNIVAAIISSEIVLVLPKLTTDDQRALLEAMGRISEKLVAAFSEETD